MPAWRTRRRCVILRGERPPMNLPRGVFDFLLQDLSLPERVLRAFEFADLKTIEDVVSRSERELCALRGIGP